jgi:4-hydroxyphenylpyruvate dioxygenase
MDENPLKLKRLHHVEFIVGNAKQAAYFYRRAFGFSIDAYAGLETGRRDSASYVLKQGEARFVVSTPLNPEGLMSDHLKKHGDGVRDIAFEAEDAEESFSLALSRGAKAAVSPQTLKDAQGSVRHAAVQTYGDTIHSFLSKKDYRGPFLPGYQAISAPGTDAGILLIDHIVGNVNLGYMNVWAEWYARVCGFYRYMSFDDTDISTEYSALQSIVMANDAAKIKMPINEPAPARRKSQIQEYLDFYQGPGVQHIALLTENIIATVRALKERGVKFLQVPDSYYLDLPGRVGSISESLDELKSLGILVDRDQEGYLLQIFTETAADRPTLFLEIIQRRGSRGFGKGNFKALFEAIEREQARRGNL